MDDFEIFWNVYQNTAERQKFTPYSKDYLKKEFELFFGNNQAVLFFGEYQNTVISTAFIVYANGSGFYHHGASNNPFPGITASELVQWRAIQEAKRRGMKRYNFWGIVPESATKHPWHGLSKFKRSFGGFEEAYVHAQDMVLTVRYWFNVIVETVRKMRRRL
jgi:lipid II:glycine glycyltransferase (peptidoglycan interpeptide bridge formation enzyme)